MKRLFKNIIKIQNIEVGTVWIEKTEDEVTFIHPEKEPNRIMFRQYQSEFFEEIKTTLF